ncbi:MAG: HAD hydrolase family protein, partial [Oligoflexia bacterium]|nr:HAD hydrolase family protein [Oligoflexia bacterium]
MGEKIGLNSPFPHPDVIKRLRSLRKKGVIISLCTAKPHYSIQNIIADSGLDNLHITNGGGVIIDPIDNVILKKHIIDNKVAIKIIETYLENNVYTEFYTIDNYFIQNNQLSDVSKIHTHILQNEPRIVTSLRKEAKRQEIVKIMPIARNE